MAYVAYMIVVTARLQTTDDKRDDFVRVVQAMCEASRREPGCQGYRLYEDTEQPNRYLILEEWDDDAALQQHFTEAHTGEFMGKVFGLVVGESDAAFHTVASTRRLGPGGLVDA
jgi:quinol monooxygenase YgiN